MAIVLENLKHLESNMKENFPYQQWPLTGYEIINSKIVLPKSAILQLNEEFFNVKLKMNLFGDLY